MYLDGSTGSRGVGTTDAQPTLGFTKPNTLDKVSARLIFAESVV
jgi:hypothetical protein